MKLSPLLAACSLLIVGVSAHAADAGPNLMSNGDFESGALGSSNSWPSGAGLSLEKDEDGNHFLRIHAEEAGKQIQAYRKITIPGGTPKITVSFKARSSEIAPGAESWHTGRVVLHFKDAAGQIARPDPAPFAFKGTSEGWVEKSVTLDVPEGATELEFMAALFQVAQGTLDIDEVVVTPAES